MMVIGMIIESINVDIKEWAQKSGFKIVDLSDKIISFHLDRHACYEAKTGICSLDLTDMEVNIRAMHEVAEKYCVKATNCPGIFKAMQAREYESIYMCVGDKPKWRKMVCGHYECNGQHRICVAKHKKIVFPFSPNEFETSTMKCGFCRNEDGYVLVR